jgi:ClpP class serine protease
MKTWLILPDVLTAIEEGRKDARSNGWQPSAEERERFVSAMHAAHTDGSGATSKSRIMRVEGKTAVIAIDGALTETPDCWAMLFGGGNTTYAEIRSALQAADADPAVEDILQEVNSPGGTVEGLFETLAVQQATKKPIRSRASLAASAAYALVANPGPIEATTPAATFGSIGVAISMRVSKDVVDIASTEAPNKRPNVGTPEGVAVVKERLDDIHELFADAIAHGRAETTNDPKIDVAHVNANFGRGGVFLAAEAKKRKMIDSAPKPAYRARAAKTASADLGGALSEEVEDMTKEQLKAAHPELFAAVLEDGVKAGTAEERDRVTAHLTLGKASGDMETAVEAVASGAGMTATIQAKYMAAGMNKRDVSARQADEAVVATAANGAQGSATPTAAGKSPADIVADAVCGPAKEGK